MIKKVLFGVIVLSVLLLIFLLQFNQFRQSTVCLVTTTATFENPEEIAQFSTALKSLPAVCNNKSIFLAATPLISTKLFHLTEHNQPVKKILADAIHAVGLHITPIPVAQTTVGAQRLQQFYKELKLLPVATNISPFASSTNIVKDGITISIQEVSVDENAQYLPHSKDITLKSAIEALTTTSQSASDFTITILTGNIEKALMAHGLEKRDLLLALVQNRANTMIVFDRKSLLLDKKLLGRKTLYHTQTSPEITVTQIDFIQKTRGKTIPLFHPTVTTKLADFPLDKPLLASLHQITILEQKKEKKLIAIERDASFDLWESGETTMERLLHDALRSAFSSKNRSILTLVKVKRETTSLAKGVQRTARSLEQIYREDDYPLLVELSPKLIKEILQMNTESERFSLSPIRYRYQKGEFFLPRSVTRKNVSVVMSSTLYRTIAEKMDTFPQPKKIYPKKVKHYLLDTVQKKNRYRFYPRWVIIQDKKNG